jgi:hypothetical protein
MTSFLLFESLRLEAWGYTNKAHLRGLLEKESLTA